MPDIRDVLEKIVVVGDRWLPVAWLFEGVSCFVVVSKMVN